MVGFNAGLADEQAATSYKFVALTVYPDVKILRYVFTGQPYIYIFDHSPSFGRCKEQGPEKNLWPCDLIAIARFVVAEKYLRWLRHADRAAPKKRQPSG